ncbi:MAG: hypothetical protein BRD40_04295 [Bacteroidetes bacterium QS_1_65_9]|jgi:clan AA aspartic protease|nr:MAG: hypothetical protein BRD40_04295 [Bacteroidetes bacterium QS_1_65_9]
MIVGKVSMDGEALVRVQIRRRGAQAQDVEAILDTGFNGSLALPYDQIQEMDLPRAGRAKFVAASGQVHVVGRYEASVRFGGKHKDIEVVEAAEPLLGTKMLRGYEVCINYAEDGHIEIEAVP